MVQCHLNARFLVYSSVKIHLFKPSRLILEGLRLGSSIEKRAKRKRMNSWKRVGLAMLCISVVCQAGVDDTEYWFHLGAKHKLDDTHGLKISSEHRFKEDIDRYASNNLDIGYSTKLNSVFSYSINMRVEGVRKSGTRWKEEWRPNFNVTAKKGLGPVFLSNRSRLEWRILEGASDLARFRNRAELTYPISDAPYGLAPFIADEQFVDSKHGEINQNRAFAGVKFKVDRWSPKVFVFDKAVKKNGDWGHSLVYGLTVYTSF